MSLRVKFAWLLAMLGLAVLIALAAAWWSVQTISHEVREPVHSMADVLSNLVLTKQAIQHQNELLDRRAPERDDARMFTSFADAANLAIRQLEQDEWALTRTGKTSLVALKTRLAAARTHGRAWYAAQANDDLASARTALQESAALIDRMQTRTIADARQILLFETHLRHQLLVVLVLAFSITSLTIVLGMSFIRRWVLRPVADLRIATAKFAQGDLTHRLAVPKDLGRDELMRLSAEVNHMASTVKAVQDERVERERLAAIGEMVRRLAHNLRNPLAGIRGLAELTRGDARTLGDAGADVIESQSRIIASVDRFEKWLNDLLNVTRPARIAPQPTHTKAWLTGLVEAHRPMAITRGVELTLDQSAAPELATFDARHLEHALSAILSNAIEASTPRSENTARGHPIVEVRSSVAQGELGQEGPVWELSVQDSGPGVPPELRERIFVPYFTTKHDGNGIGLAVAMQVVKAHGGQIVISDARYHPSPNSAASLPNLPGTSESGPQAASGDFEPNFRGRGACFRVRLPLETPGRSRGAERPTDTSSLANSGQSGAPVGQHPDR